MLFVLRDREREGEREREEGERERESKIKRRAHQSILHFYQVQVFTEDCFFKIYHTVINVFMLICYSQDFSKRLISVNCLKFTSCLSICVCFLPVPVF